MKHVILFGAGASHGTQHILYGSERRSPPLGFQLFDELAMAYPAIWGNLPPPYPQRFRENFEAGMLEVISSGDHRISLLMQSMAAFFANYRPDGSGLDLYSQLIRRTVERGNTANVLFSSLNYECALELAVSRFLPVDYWQESAGKSISVWKLHSSCNFIPGSPERQVTMRRGASFGFGMTVNAGITIVDPQQVRAWVSSDTALFPVMSLFAPGKPSMFSPATLTAVQTRWAERVRGADNVVVVGVWPLVDDEHIWSPLAESCGTLHYAGSKDGLDSWLPHRSGRPTSFLGPTFESAFDAIANLLAT